MRRQRSIYRRLSPARHAVAVNIAEGYVRTAAEGELAVVTVQYGPGAESAFGGIAQAFNDRAPILFLPTGYPRGSEAVTPNFEARRNFHHITKWCEAASRVEHLPKLMHSAISRVRNGRPAPVLLELPVDLLAEKVDRPNKPIRGRGVVRRKPMRAKSPNWSTRF